MAKYVFINVPAYGHINPTLAVVHELVARGEQVTYYLTEEFRSTIEATGAEFRSYDLPQLKAFAAAPTQPLPLFLASISGDVASTLLDPIRAEHADVLVYDMMCFWGKLIAQALNLRAALVSPTYVNMREMAKAMAPRPGKSATTEQVTSGQPEKAASALGTQASTALPGMNISPAFFAQANQQLAQAYQRLHLPPQTMQEVFFQGQEGLIISFIPRTFQPGYEQLDEHYYFAGPSIAARSDANDFPLERLAGKNVLYISLGTAFNNQVAFFNTCIAAFKHSPWQVVLAYGKRIDPADLDPIPANFIAHPHVPQLEVLTQTNIFISHGGMNSTMESLYNGVPLVVIPQMVEQEMTARRIQALGLGVLLARDNVSVESLHAAVAYVQNDVALHERVSAMQQEVRRSPGYKGAATQLIEYAQKSRL
jgi:glycosyltransferase, MGT family